MGQRHAVTRVTAVRYAAASKGAKAVILDELCALTGWHRDHARKALAYARPRVVRARVPRPPKYGVEVMVALRFCWAVLGAPTGKRLAPVMSELVATLRRFGELEISEEVAAALVVRCWCRGWPRRGRGPSPTSRLEPGAQHRRAA